MFLKVPNKPQKMHSTITVTTTPINDYISLSQNHIKKDQRKLIHINNFKRGFSRTSQLTVNNFQNKVISSYFFVKLLLTT